MKPQDILFFVILAVLIGLRKPKYLVIAGLACIVLSIPLFHFWVFFTAQRLIMYSFGFLFIAVIISLWNNYKN
jgi:hypothetical protein